MLYSFLNLLDLLPFSVSIHLCSTLPNSIWMFQNIGSSGHWKQYELRYSYFGLIYSVFSTINQQVLLTWQNLSLLKEELLFSWLNLEGSVLWEKNPWQVLNCSWTSPCKATSGLIREKMSQIFKQSCFLRKYFRSRLHLFLHREGVSDSTHTHKKELRRNPAVSQFWNLLTIYHLSSVFPSNELCIFFFLNAFIFLPFKLCHN